MPVPLRRLERPILIPNTLVVLTTGGTPTLRRAVILPHSLHYEGFYRWHAVATELFGCYGDYMWTKYRRISVIWNGAGQMLSEYQCEYQGIKYV